MYGYTCGLHMGYNQHTQSQYQGALDVLLRDLITHTVWKSKSSSILMLGKIRILSASQHRRLTTVVETEQKHFLYS